MISNGVNPHGSAMQTPLQNMAGRPSLPSQAGPPPSSSSGPSGQPRAHSTPKSSKPRQSTSSLPAPPLDDVHAAFVEFRAKEEDKVLRRSLFAKSITSFDHGMLILSFHQTTSASLSNAFIVNKYAQKILAGNDNIF